MQYEHLGYGVGEINILWRPGTAGSGGAGTRLRKVGTVQSQRDWLLAYLTE